MNHAPWVARAVALAVAAAAFLPRAAAGADDRRITYNLGADPRTLDPALANGVPEAHVILNIIEGLTRTDEKGEPVPAMAERWDISPDGRTHTFHLRDARWMNGEPVTADDFVYGWLRNLDPRTGGEYAYMLFLVEGAEDYNAGKTTDTATVAVRAVNDKTLEVRLKNPTPYFLSALAHYAFAPLKESWVKAHPKFASEPENYPSNGPFTLAGWRHGDRLILRKNPAYYNADKVWLDTLVMTTISNESTALLQWEAGESDITDTVPLPDIPRLKAEGKYRSNPYLGVYYVAFQNTRKPFDDPRVRKAFSLAINREQIARAILRGGQPAATALVPPGIQMNGRDYREAGGSLFKEDVAEAKRLLAEAGYPDGRGFPRVRYLFNDMESHRTIGEALQDMWRTNLGVRVDLDVQEWKVYLQNRKQKNYQMARAGWIGDYLDAITFLDMFTSGSGNNDFGYINPDFDRLVEQAKAETDSTRREKLLREAEQMVIARDMAVAPIYFYLHQYLQKPRVTGVTRNPLGYIYFDRGRLDDPKVTAVLELQGVDVERDGAKILSGVDWRISRSENWVLFGPNGAGKTTLLSLLTGYLWPTAGTVDVLGRRLGETDVFELRRLTAVVSDSLRGMINPELTGFQVLVTGARGHLNLFGAPTPVEIRLATHTADLTETGELMTKPFRIMSTGERQRVLIARALMIRPKLLILDEPCAGLDIAAREFVLCTAERAATQRGGPSLILTTHHVEEVTPVFSHCLMLLRGQVFARGKVAEVLRSSILSELFGIEISAAHRHGRWTASVTPAG